jgi:hypothetical protein
MRAAMESGFLKESADSSDPVGDFKKSVRKIERQYKKDVRSAIKKARTRHFRTSALKGAAGLAAAGGGAYLLHSSQKDKKKTAAFLRPPKMPKRAKGLSRYKELLTGTRLDKIEKQNRKRLFPAAGKLEEEAERAAVHATRGMTAGGVVAGSFGAGAYGHARAKERRKEKRRAEKSKKRTGFLSSMQDAVGGVTKTSAPVEPQEELPEVKDAPERPWVTAAKDIGAFGAGVGAGYGGLAAANALAKRRMGKPLITSRFARHAIPVTMGAGGLLFSHWQNTLLDKMRDQSAARRAGGSKES